MSNCKEFVLDDLMAITAFTDFNSVSQGEGGSPVYTRISPGDLASPVNKLTPTIDMTNIVPVYTNAITIGLQSAANGGALIPIKRFTGKAKDDESDSVAGRLHTVTVSCEVDDRDSSVWNHLLTLERGTYHLLLTFRDGVTRGFVCASQDTYLCNVERDGSKTTVTFRIQCLMGIQLIV